MKIFKCVLMLMLSLLLSIPGIAEEKKKTSVPEKSGLGDWWHHSSLKYKPMPDKLLFHTELQYADRKLTGNDEGYVHNGSASFYIRKHRFTDRVTYSINKYDIDQSDGGHTDKDYQMFEELLRFDLTEYLYPEAGIIWETDSKNLIEDRYIYYGGVGSLLSFKRHQINIALCYGLQHEEYDPIVEQLIGIGEDDSRIIYFYQTYDWLIRDKIAFQEGFRIIQSLNNTGEYRDMPPYERYGETKRYRYIFRLALDFKINNFFSIVPSYQIQYDSNPWPGVYKKDTIQIISLRFSY